MSGNSRSSDLQTAPIVSDLTGGCGGTASASGPLLGASGAGWGVSSGWAGSGALSSMRSGISIGRTPDAGVFLDDVTVSRNHALLVRRKDGLYIDDLGSLNGTYVNRRRIESHQLQDGDEIQIGKYKLSYLEK